MVSKCQAASRKKTISYADGDDDGNEEDSFKIRSGRRWHDEVTCRKFRCVYSHSEFVPPCILCISSGGSFRSSGENQEITKKIERGNMNKVDRERERKSMREKERKTMRERKRMREKENEREREMSTRNQILSFNGGDSRVKISWGTKSKLVFVRYSLAHLHRHHRRRRRRRRARPN